MERSLNQPLSQALNPKKSNLLPALLLVLGLIVALSAATYGYLESRRTEQVVIAVRAVPFGQPITAGKVQEVVLETVLTAIGFDQPQLITFNER